MSLAQLKIDIKAIFNDLTGKTANVKGDEIATAIWQNPNGTLGSVKECGDADYTILDDDGFDTFIFRDISANRNLNYPTLSANPGRKIKAILVSTTETLTLNVAPATDWAAADVITGQTSAATCIVVAKLTALTYKVKSRSGVYTLGEIIGVTGTAAKLADQGAAYPTLAHDGYKITQVHEGTDKMNGYAADIDITEWGGWWELTGTATEWRGITDGNSTIYYIGAETAFNFSTTALTYDEDDDLTLTPPKGNYYLDSEFNIYVYNTSSSEVIAYAGLGTVLANNAPNLCQKRQDLIATAGTIGLYAAYFFNNIPFTSINGTTVIYIKSASGGTSAATIHRSYAASGIPKYIRARRIS